MGNFIIGGGKKLAGSVSISGAKNSVLALATASLLSGGVCILDNVPCISDIKLCFEILESLGADIKYLGKNKVQIDTSKVNSCNVPYDLATKMRASTYFLGALLGRFHEAHVALPGGCKLGDRPIDQHLKAFETLGARQSIDEGEVNLYADKLVGNSIYLDFASVGATINAMIASVLTEEGSLTIIENAAKEPHVVDCANFLNTMGAHIIGAGTDTIKIRGVKELKKRVEYSVIPDQIEAGTFMAAAAATGSDITIENVIPKHLESITAVLRKIGVKVEESYDSVRVIADEPLKRTNVHTLPHPGFPTDMQPQITAVLTLADGSSMISDDIFEKRFEYVQELRRMGADIRVKQTVAIVEGVRGLRGAPVEAPDLRGGAALVIAALAAKGTTEISATHYIKRGYEDLVGKLKGLGADIVEVTDGGMESKKKA